MSRLSEVTLPAQYEPIVHLAAILSDQILVILANLPI